MRFTKNAPRSHFIPPPDSPTIPMERFKEAFDVVTYYYEVAGESKAMAWNVALERYGNASRIYCAIANSFRE